MNKKGAELTIGTLVIIVLAIIVLVVIALGFGMGWGNLWSRMTGFFSTANVDSVKNACTYACDTGSGYDYCCLKREVVLQKADKSKDTTTYGDDNALTCLGYKTALSFPDCPAINCNEVKCLSTADETIYDDDAAAKAKCDAEINAKTTSKEKADVCSSSKRVTKGTSFELKTCAVLRATGC